MIDTTKMKDASYFRERALDSLLQAARLHAFHSYIDDQDRHVVMAANDAERYERYYLELALAETIGYLRHLSDNDDFAKVIE